MSNFNQVEIFAIGTTDKMAAFVSSVILYGCDSLDRIIASPTDEKTSTIVGCRATIYLKKGRIAGKAFMQWAREAGVQASSAPTIEE